MECWMNVVGVVLLVFFAIVSVLLILIVLIQNEEGDSLGGIFAGGSSSAFGSRSGNVLTRTTTVLGVLFLVLSLGLALINRIPGSGGVESAGRELLRESGGTNWVDEELRGVESEAAPQTPAPGLNAEPGLNVEQGPDIVPGPDTEPSAPAAGQ
jgi:preprotein translocase subunit SecG